MGIDACGDGDGDGDGTVCLGDIYLTISLPHSLTILCTETARKQLRLSYHISSQLTHVPMTRMFLPHLPHPSPPIPAISSFPSHPIRAISPLPSPSHTHPKPHPHATPTHLPTSPPPLLPHRLIPKPQKTTPTPPLPPTHLTKKSKTCLLNRTYLSPLASDLNPHPHPRLAHSHPISSPVLTPPRMGSHSRSSLPPRPLTSPHPITTLRSSPSHASPPRVRPRFPKS